jgi:hypothetical protein
MIALDKYSTPVSPTGTKPVYMYANMEKFLNTAEFNNRVAGILRKNEFDEINVSYNDTEKLLQVLEIEDQKISFWNPEEHHKKMEAVKKLVDEMNYFLKDMGYKAFLNEQNLHEIIEYKEMDSNPGLIIGGSTLSALFAYFYTHMTQIDPHDYRSVLWQLGLSLPAFLAMWLSYSSKGITQELSEKESYPIIEIVGPEGSSREDPVESFLFGQFFLIKYIYEDYLTEKSLLHNGVKTSKNANGSILIEIDNEYSITIERNGFSILEHDTSILTLYTQNQKIHPISKLEEWEVEVNGIPTQITSTHRETLKRRTKDLYYRLAENSISQSKD